MEAFTNFARIYGLMVQTVRNIFRLVAVLAIMAGASESALSARDFTVVIDAGHGGKDAGALGTKTNEKSINLKVARKLRSLLDKEKNMKVVMTRSTDNFVTLQGRCDIANSNKADIFVSIHANAIDRKSKRSKTIKGASVYTLGLSRTTANLEVAMRENGVMKLEKDYSTTYQGFDPNSAESYIMFDLMQHCNLDQSISLAGAVQRELVATAGRKNLGVKQAPFWVLVKTGMPAILVELDFICNPDEEAFMWSDEGSDKLARAIYNGIKKYRNGESSATAKKQRQQPEPDPCPEPTDTSREAPQTVRPAPEAKPAAGQIEYRVQFLTSGSKLKAGDRRFKGLKPVDSYRDGGIVKYTYGSTTSMKEANKILKEVKQLFPQAFVIKMRDGKRVK